MYYRYVGAGQQFQAFQDGGYVALPAADLSTDEVAALGVADSELVGSGLWAAADGEKPEADAVETASLQDERDRLLAMIDAANLRVADIDAQLAEAELTQQDEQGGQQSDMGGEQALGLAADANEQTTAPSEEPQAAPRRKKGVTADGTAE